MIIGAINLLMGIFFVTTHSNYSDSLSTFFFVGCGIIAMGAMMMILAPFSAANKRREAERDAKREARNSGKDNSGALRRADPTVKYRILLETKIEGYEICYRRVKSVNELVVNGMVYDEMKAILEFAHRLCATIDGHAIEAGLDEDTYSYIAFDGTIIEYKQRII